MKRSVLKRTTQLARSAWNYVRKPIARKTPIKSSLCSIKPGNLQRKPSLARQAFDRATASAIEAGARLSITPARKSLKHRSVKQALRQAAWNRITDGKVAVGLGCACCHTTNWIDNVPHGHHRLPTGRGGAWTIDNHVLLCAACHRCVHEHTAWATEAGLLITGRRAVEQAATAAPSLRKAGA